jgi:hypothetical protein
MRYSVWYDGRRHVIAPDVVWTGHIERGRSRRRSQDGRRRRCRHAVMLVFYAAIVSAVSFMSTNWRRDKVSAPYRQEKGKVARRAIRARRKCRDLLGKMAPQAGLEPATLRLTAGKNHVSRVLLDLAESC